MPGSLEKGLKVGILPGQQCGGFLLELFKKGCVGCHEYAGAGVLSSQMDVLCSSLPVGTVGQSCSGWDSFNQDPSKNINEFLTSGGAAPISYNHHPSTCLPIKSTTASLVAQLIHTSPKKQKPKGYHIISLLSPGVYCSPAPSIANHHPAKSQPARNAKKKKSPRKSRSSLSQSIEKTSVPSKTRRHAGTQALNPKTPINP